MDARARAWFPTIVLVLLCGCTEAPSPETTPERGNQLARDYRESDTGAIEGRVSWSGPRPEVAPFPVFGVAGLGREELKKRANPHAPRIDESTGGVAGAVIFLRTVDLAKSRPWDHAPVRIEQSQNLLHIFQGESTAATGFLQQGDTVEGANRDPHLHSLRGGGADFFSLPFPDKDKPSKRRMDKAGIVELSSAAGYFWMSAHLFVTEHPYYTRSDEQGRFRLERVPAGNYQLVCWMPHWEVVRKERDPESALVHRIFYRAAVERDGGVRVAPGETARNEFSWSLRDFR